MGVCTSSKKKKSTNVMNTIMPYKYPRIIMTAFIWSKNAHNLFDFESNLFTRKDIDIDFPARLVTIDDQLLALSKDEWAKNQIEIAHLQFEEPDNTKISPISSKQDHRIWAVIRNNVPDSNFNSLEYWDLNLNDIFKLGRIRLQLIAFHIINQNFNNPSEPQDNVEGDLSSCSQDGQCSDENQCRVCFSARATTENPLISPCNCTGSVKYIHVKCLQHWIGVQLKIKKSENTIQYTWKKISCEICKASLKSQYMFKGQSYSIMNIPKPKSSYMTLRVTSDDKYKEGMIYVIELDQKTELKIGRVPECDIKLKDISVSRQHAVIKLLPTERHTVDQPSYQLRLYDINSKFGTLIYAQSDFLLKIEETQVPPLFQVGRVLINFNLKKKAKLSSSSSYKHPEGIHLFNISQAPINDLITNFNQDQEHRSFQTQNELRISNILINDPFPPPQEVNQVVLHNSHQTQRLATQFQQRQSDNDLHVSDEQQQALDIE